MSLVDQMARLQMKNFFQQVVNFHAGGDFDNLIIADSVIMYVDSIKGLIESNDADSRHNAPQQFIELVN